MKQYYIICNILAIPRGPRLWVLVFTATNVTYMAQVDDQIDRSYPAPIDSVPETHAESSLFTRHLRVG
jgi:hypothetical protein